ELHRVAEDLDPAHLRGHLGLAQPHEQVTRRARTARAGVEPFGAAFLRRERLLQDLERRIELRQGVAECLQPQRQCPREPRAGFAEHQPEVARRLLEAPATRSSSGEAPPAARSSRRTSRASSTSCALESASPKNMRAVSGSWCASSKITVLHAGSSSEIPSSRSTRSAKKR